MIDYFSSYILKLRLKHKKHAHTMANNTHHSVCVLTVFQSQLRAGVLYSLTEGLTHFLPL